MHSLCLESSGDSEKYLIIFDYIHFSSHQHVYRMTSQILLILIDFDSFLLFFKPL